MSAFLHPKGCDCEYCRRSGEKARRDGPLISDETLGRIARLLFTGAPGEDFTIEGELLALLCRERYAEAVEFSFEMSPDIVKAIDAANTEAATRYGERHAHEEASS